MKRTNLAAMAEETLAILERGRYVAASGKTVDLDIERLRAMTIRCTRSIARAATACTRAG